MSALTLQELYKALQDNDISGEYENLTYAHNINSLYPEKYSNAGLPWFSFFPFANWSNFYSNTYPAISPVQEALLETITLAQKYIPEKGQVFLDIANYDNVDDAFLNQEVPVNSPEVSVLGQIASYINSLPEDVEPILRVLIGRAGQVNFSDLNDGSSSTVTAFFKGLITHPKAKMYFGFYASNLTRQSPALEALPHSINTFWQELRKLLHELLVKLPQPIQDRILKLIAFLEAHEGNIRTVIGQLVYALAHNATGWNHSKFLSVNGTTSVAAGYNWWDGYATGRNVGNYYIFDTGVKFGGDMAVSSHLFMDDVFRYLNGSHPYDTWSFAAGSPIGNGATTPNFTSSPVPLWSDSGRSTTQLEDAPQVKGISIASVTRDPTNSEFNFPTLAFNAIRDLALDFIYVFGANVPQIAVDLGAYLGPELSDDAQVIKDLLHASDVSPAAWSSRYGRVWAIANAKKSVKIFNQAVVNRFLDGKAQKPAIAEVNKIFALLAAETGVKIPTLWDGLIWGYDTLIAIAKALARNIPVTIIASSEPGKDGYSDAVTAPQFIARLEKVMDTLLVRKIITLPTGVTAALQIASYFEYKHMSFYAGPGRPKSYASHSKCVIIDDFLFYGGSDNAYPNYNDQFGAWIGDNSVAKLSGPDGYWTNLNNVAK